MTIMSGGQSKVVQAEGNVVAPCCIFRLCAQIPKTYLYYLTSGGILPCAQISVTETFTSTQIRSNIENTN